MNILGISFNRISLSEALDSVCMFLDSTEGHTIVTPNPEIILQAQNNEELYHAISDADLKIIDGTGVQIAGWFMGYLTRRIPGADLTIKILKLAEQRNEKVTVLIDIEGLSMKKDIEESLGKQFPELEISVISLTRVSECREFDFGKIDSKILLTTLGAPYQEVFSDLAIKGNKKIRLAMGVGGSIDYLTKKTWRAPKVMRFLGIEWLWRVILSPRRLKRIINAVVVFPIEFIKWRFVLPFLYRPNVACLLFRRNPDGRVDILITERKGEDGTWQLPQGGTDGEDLMTAGERELGEEIGTNNFTGLASFMDVHKYSFGKSSSPRNTKYGYKGQKQGLYIAEFFGNDDSIEICRYEHQQYKWVNAVDLVEEVEEIRRESTRKFLKLFRSTGIIK